MWSLSRALKSRARVLLILFHALLLRLLFDRLSLRWLHPAPGLRCLVHQSHSRERHMLRRWLGS